LRGFVWRGDERIKDKDDIFPPEEKELHEKILRESRKQKQKPDKPMEVMEQTLNYDKNAQQEKAPAARLKKNKKQ
jgi:hypothetical protein